MSLEPLLDEAEHGVPRASVILSQFLGRQHIGSNVGLCALSSALQVDSGSLQHREARSGLSCPCVLGRWRAQGVDLLLKISWAIAVVSKPIGEAPFVGRRTLPYFPGAVT